VWASAAGLSALLALAGGIAEPAAAANLAFTGSTQTVILGSALFPQTQFTIAGTGVATVSSTGGGHLTQFALGGGTFATSGLLIPVTDPAVAAVIPQFQATAANGPGLFVQTTTTPTTATAMNSSFGGPMAIQGVAKVCFFGASCAAAAGNLSVPLSVIGVGGAQASSKSGISLTVVGAPWTIETAIWGLSASLSTAPMGLAHGPASATSSTANPSGVIQLVTPFFISTDLGSAAALIPGYSRLTLHFVPEPGTIVMLGSGMVAFVAYGSSVRRR
jgi:hypothetical protein